MLWLNKKQITFKDDKSDEDYIQTLLCLISLALHFITKIFQ